METYITKSTRNENFVISSPTKVLEICCSEGSPKPFTTILRDEQFLPPFNDKEEGKCNRSKVLYDICLLQDFLSSIIRSFQFRRQHSKTMTAKTTKDNNNTNSHQQKHIKYKYKSIVRSNIFKRPNTSVSTMLNCWVSVFMILSSELILKTQGSDCLPCIGMPCEKVTGLFTSDTMPLGYNVVTTIPASACNLTVHELHDPNNFLGMFIA